MHVQSNMTISIICSELMILLGDQLSLTVHVHKLECLVKRLLCCIQGQGHSESSLSRLYSCISGVFCNTRDTDL